MSIISRLLQTFTGRGAHGAPASSAAAGGRHPEKLPPFTLATAELMRYDPQVRIALAARNGLLLRAETVIAGPTEEAEFFRRQWERIWASSARELLRAKLYGFAPFEVIFRRAPGGGVEFDRLLDLHPRRARLLTRGGRPAGFALELPSAGGGPPREVRLTPPKSLVCTFEAEFGNPYGCSLLERAFPAWCEKWMEGGAKKTLRLRMMKDAYIGDILWYPPDRQVTLPGGTEVSWRDIARELVEARMSGGALTLPLVLDRDGRRLLDYTPPQDVGGSAHIFQWKREVDSEIWKALEIPPEILEAGGSGSGYSGRSIPFMVALSAVQVEFAEIVRCVERDLLRPLAQLHFGREPSCTIEPRSLLDAFGL